MMIISIDRISFRRYDLTIILKAQIISKINQINTCIFHFCLIKVKHSFKFNSVLFSTYRLRVFLNYAKYVNHVLSAQMNMLKIYCYCAYLDAHLLSLLHECYQIFYIALKFLILTFWLSLQLWVLTIVNWPMTQH